MSGESTATLINRISRGDARAREQLLARCLPLLNRWARGRLPAAVRRSVDTADIVQVSMMRAFTSLDRFKPKQEGSFMAYLRQIALNAVRDEIRKLGRSPDMTDRIDRLPDNTDSVLQAAVTDEALQRYELALEELTARQRDAVILRLEFGMSFPEIAEEVGETTSDAARMLVSRGLVKLAQTMQ